MGLEVVTPAGLIQGTTLLGNHTQDGRRKTTATSSQLPGSQGRFCSVAKKFTLLVLLAQRMGDVLSRTLIAGQVWDMNFDSDTNVVDVTVRRLRRKVDEPFATKLIHTVRGVGYVLEAR